VDTQTRFAASLKLPFPLLADHGGTVAKQYGVFDEDRGLATRGTFVIDKNGIVRWTKVEANPLDLLDPAEVLKALKESGV